MGRQGPLQVWLVEWCDALDLAAAAVGAPTNFVAECAHHRQQLAARQLPAARHSCQQRLYMQDRGNADCAIE